MLEPLRKLNEEPEDVPMIPNDVAEHLQAKLNAGYVISTSKIAQLKAAGYSDATIAGFLLGCQYACNIIDEVQAIRKMQQEEGLR